MGDGLAAAVEKVGLNGPALVMEGEQVASEELIWLLRDGLAVTLGEVQPGIAKAGLGGEGCQEGDGDNQGRALHVDRIG